MTRFVRQPPPQNRVLKFEDEEESSFAEQERHEESFPKKRKMEEREWQKLKKMKRWRIIIRNLPFSITEAQLREVVEKFGAIHDIVFPQKKLESGELVSRGFAFVQFSDFKAATAAFKSLNMNKIRGRKVALDWAVPKDDYLTAAEEEREKQRQTASSSEIPPSEEVITKSEKTPSANHKRFGGSDSGESEGGNEEMDKGGSLSSDGEDESGDGGMADEDDGDSVQRKGGGKLKKSQQLKKPDVGIQEGRTLFIRNLSFDTTEEELRSSIEQFGPLNYCLICKYPGTDHSKGSGFVQFKLKEDATKCLQATSHNELSGMGGLKLGGRQLTVCEAMEKEKLKTIEEERKEKQPKDKRNLHLLRVSLIREGTEAAAGMSETDSRRRVQIEAANRRKIKNLHVFVSSTRLCVHNMPTALNDKELRSICMKSVNDPAARITECRIMRDMERLNSSGKGKSRGFGFVDFTEHSHALACLHALNNNPMAFSDKKRPIVEFSLENKMALNKKEKRKEKAATVARLAGSERTFPLKRQKMSDKPEFNARLEVGDLEQTKKNLRQGGKKPLPSHIGPKIRHKSRNSSNRKNKNMSKKKGFKGGKKNFKSKREKNDQRGFEKMRKLEKAAKKKKKVVGL